MMCFQEGASPLTTAVRKSHVEMAEFLLKDGADVNVKDQDERSLVILNNMCFIAVGQKNLLCPYLNFLCFLTPLLGHATASHIRMFCVYRSAIFAIFEF